MMSDLIFRLHLSVDAALEAIDLHRLLRQPEQQRQVQTLAGGSAGAMPNISKGRLMAMEIEMPPVHVQRDCARRAAAIDTRKAAHRASLAQLDALFASLQRSFLEPSTFRRLREGIVAPPSFSLDRSWSATPNIATLIRTIGNIRRSVGWTLGNIRRV